jgi:thiol-disulfide isomerase/thioredoxin
MKKSLSLLSILLLFIYFDGFAQNRSIRFVEKPWSEILAAAKQENKLIFLDAYTTWCGPCKWMAAKIFTNDTIADYYNTTFICAHFDMEKGEGLELARVYQVRAYPTLLFLNGAGELIHLRVGAPQKVKDYFDMGKIALTPGEGFGAYMKKYQEGNRDPYFIMKFFDRLQGAYMPINEPLSQYFASQKEADLLNRANWDMLYRYVYDIDSKEFNYLLKHHKEYEKRYTKDSVSAKISGVYSQALTTLSRNMSFNEASYNQLKQKMRDSGYESAEKVIFTGDLNLYQSKSDSEKFINLAITGVDTYYSDDYTMLNRIAWNFYQIATDKKHLEKATQWAKKSIALKSTSENNDTYANLMYKLGNKTEAIKYEKKAIAIAQKEKADTKAFEATLKKFEGKSE